MADLKPAAQRVQEALRDKGLEAQVRHMPQTTRSAEQAAAACGCSAGKPYLLLVSGANRVNEVGVASVIGEALRRPDANDVRNITGFAIGGIPPLGHTSALLTFMDEALLGYELIWAAAGTPDAVFSIAPHRLAAATGARIICVA